MLDQTKELLSILDRYLIHDSGSHYWVVISPTIIKNDCTFYLYEKKENPGRVHSYKLISFSFTDNRIFKQLLSEFEFSCQLRCEYRAPSHLIGDDADTT